MLLHDPALEPKPAVRPRVDGNLPEPPTSFLGRVREIAELTAVIQSPGTPLLTLTGAGGSGKTRLALRVADACSHQYPDGAWFVDFADVTNPELIASVICQAFGLAEQPGRSPIDQLREWLIGRELLLVLDNLEQLAEGTGVLGELLAACSGVTLLVTSREPLHLAREQQYEVPVLAVADAVEMFVRRAQAIAPQRSIDPALAAEICKRLDCLPLAIELAAARTKALSATELLARLEKGLPLLTGGPRDAPRRQQTLKATIDWGYQLLTPDERRLFARLAVFTGGCTLPAAEAVCGAQVDTVQALVDRSLVRTDNERYWMLQTIRQYALERLEETGEEDALRHAHARWLVDQLGREGLAQPGRPNDGSMIRVAPERENFRAALEWASGNGMVEIVGSLASSLVEVWIRAGQFHEAERWITLALRHEHEYNTRLAAQVVSAARAIAWHRGAHAQTTALAQRALALWREVGDPAGIGKEMVSAGRAAAMGGDLTRARADFQQAIGFARERGMEELLAVALNDLGDVALREGQLEEGRSLCQECLAVTPPGSVTGVIALVNLAHIANREGRTAEATRLARGALETALGRGDMLTASWAAFEAAWPLARQGDLERSARLLGAGTAFLETTGAEKDWMLDECETAVTRILHSQLDLQGVLAMVAEGREMSLEDAVRDELGASDARPP